MVKITKEAALLYPIRILVQLVHGVVFSGIIHAVVVYKAAGAAQNAPPGQAEHRAKVAVTGQEYCIGFHIVINIIRHGNVVCAPLPVVA